jgi:hypothetical protein
MGVFFEMGDFNCLDLLGGYEIGGMSGCRKGLFPEFSGNHPIFFRNSQ